MAYQYQTAWIRPKHDPSQLTELDISGLALNAVFDTYSQITIQLLHTPTGNIVYLDLYSVREQIGVDTRPRTILDWLTANGNNTLPTVAVKPNDKPNVALYSDVFRAGYSVTPADVNRHPNSPIPMADRSDLLLTKKDIDYMHYAPYLLATVNGMVHRVVGSQYGFYILKGNKSAQIANNNVAGLISFRTVSPLKIIKITPNMVYKTHPNQELKNHAYVDLKESTEGKSVMLVLGGCLHMDNTIFKMISDRTARIDFNNLLFPQRIYDSIDRIDLSSLHLDGQSHNEHQYAISDLYKDSRLLAYLTLPQSFFVILDTPYLYSKKHYLEMTGLPGRFLTHKGTPRYPLFSSFGRIYDYIEFPKDNRMVLSCDDNRHLRYNFTTNMWKREMSLDRHRYSSWPWDWAHGHLLEIGRV